MNAKSWLPTFHVDSYKETGQSSGGTDWFLRLPLLEGTEQSTTGEAPSKPDSALHDAFPSQGLECVKRSVWNSHKLKDCHS